MENERPNLTEADGGVKVEGELRNPDGTFAVGHHPKITENYGRPKSDVSYRALAKKRAERNPDRLKKDLDALDDIIDNPKSTQIERMKAVEMKIKLNGNFDAQETKGTMEVTNNTYNPFADLTTEELRKLANE